MRRSIIDHLGVIYLVGIWQLDMGAGSGVGAVLHLELGSNMPYSFPIFIWLTAT